MNKGEKSAVSHGAVEGSKKQRIAISWAASPKFKVPIPAREPERLAALKQYEILDTAPETSFDDIAELAANICGTPIAMISLVDSDRQWFKAKVGISQNETARDIAFCAHAIMGRDLFIVPDAALDDRFAANPLVTTNPQIRFYAGTPLVTPDDHAVGTLCVIDRIPRQLTMEQQQALRVLGRHVVALLELRRRVASLQREVQTLRLQAPS